MTSWWESLLVAVVVGLALAWAVRAVWGYFRGQKSCTGCGSDGGCAGGGPRNLVQDLTPLAGPDDPSASRDSSGRPSSD